MESWLVCILHFLQVLYSVDGWFYIPCSRFESRMIPVRRMRRQGNCRMIARRTPAGRATSWRFFATCFTSPHCKRRRRSFSLSLLFSSSSLSSWYGHRGRCTGTHTHTQASKDTERMQITSSEHPKKNPIPSSPRSKTRRKAPQQPSQQR